MNRIKTIETKDIAKTVAQIFGVKNSLDGKSFLNEIMK